MIFSMKKARTPCVKLRWQLPTCPAYDVFQVCFGRAMRITIGSPLRVPSQKMSSTRISAVQAG